MKTIITLDYEMFLGSSVGTVDKNLIKPMSLLTSIGYKYGVRFVIFVDGSYLSVMKELSQKHSELKAEYDKIAAHLLLLKSQGNDIQLHVHPHWFFSNYNNGVWNLSNNRYKLSDLTEDEANICFRKSKEAIEEIVGEKLIAFRAGGFSAEPSSLLIKLMKENNIVFDSSVYRGSYYHSSHQQYDYRSVPEKIIYKFSENITKEDCRGEFREVSISSDIINPFFYWKMIFRRLIKVKSDKILGDGIAVKTTKESIIDRITKKSISFATIDGYKSSYLLSMFNRKNNKLPSDEYFVVIGHPKLTSLYSLEKFENFCAQTKNKTEFITFKNLMINK